MSGTLTPPRERLDRGEGTGLGRPWLVIVLNDDHNTFQGVAAALSAVVPGVSYDDGMRLANRIHNSGQAIVWSGLREQAELYWEQLRRAWIDAGAARAGIDGVLDHRSGSGPRTVPCARAPASRSSTHPAERSARAP